MPSVSALESPSLVPSSSPTAASVKKIVFSDTLLFIGGNAATALQPSGIRLIQAAIGCTFQSPLETVSITNITTVNHEALPFDPTAASLVSNGSVVCLNLTLIHRRLSPILQSQFQITFSITNPSPWLLSLNETQIVDLVAASPSMNLLGATLGSIISSISSARTVESVPSNDSAVGLIIGVCLGSIAVALATSLLVLHRHSAKTKIVIQNPVAKTREWQTTNEDERIKFAPEMIRDRIHV